METKSQACWRRGGGSVSPGSLPCVSLFESKTPGFPLNSGPLLLLSLFQQCPGLRIRGVCVREVFTPSPHILGHCAPRPLCSWALLYTLRPCSVFLHLHICLLQSTAVTRCRTQVVLLLSTQFCNRFCVYSGVLPPSTLCASYLDRRADACQVWQQRGQGGRWGWGLAVAGSLV